MHVSLNLKKIASRWVPNQLADYQKKLLDICRENFLLKKEKIVCVIFLQAISNGLTTEKLIVVSQVLNGLNLVQGHHQQSKEEKFDPKSMFNIA